MLLIKGTGKSDGMGRFTAEKTEILFHRLTLEETDKKMRSLALAATGIDIGEGRFLGEWPEGRMYSGENADGTARVWAEKTPYTLPLMVEGNDRVYAEAWNMMVFAGETTYEYAAIPDM